MSTAELRARHRARSRSNSIKEGLSQVPLANQSKKRYVDEGFFHDLKTFKWTTNPATSLKLIIGTVAAWTLMEKIGVKENPLTPALFISYPLHHQVGDKGTHYGKGRLDLVFVGFYIIVFSFIRQFVTERLLRPLARLYGLQSNSKQLRFVEQAYAVVYNIVTAYLGLSAMYNSDVWYYQTEHFWIGYPHWRMTAHVKWYYLLQASYWSQQMLVLGLRLEKPRSDYYQLIAHHLVTIWLISWSYFIDLTMIGIAVFCSMDIPEIFLAGSKCLNYVGLQRTSEVSFLTLLGVWTYMRHYLNLKMLWSTWYEFDLIPEYNRTWTPPASNPNAWWLFSGAGTGRIPSWIRYQIFLPIFLLHAINTFWTYLLWRVLYKILVGEKAEDIREAGEDDEDKDD